MAKKVTVEQLADAARLQGMIRNGRATKIRKDAGLSAAQVARFLGTTTASVLRWETGERIPRDLDLAQRWLRLLSELEAAHDEEAAPPLAAAATG